MLINSHKYNSYKAGMKYEKQLINEALGKSHSTENTATATASANCH